MRNVEGRPTLASTTLTMSIKKSAPSISESVWGRTGFGRSWIRSFIAASPCFLAPLTSISVFITLAQYDASFSLFAEAVMKEGFWSICIQYGPRLTLKGVLAVICWVGLQALLFRYLPGDTHKGQLTPAGYLLSYRINGLSAWIITHVLYIVLSLVGVLDPGFIPRNWNSLIGAMNLAGYVISTFAFIKAYMMPTHPEDRKFSGTLLYLLLLARRILT